MNNRRNTYPVRFVKFIYPFVVMMSDICEHLLGCYFLAGLGLLGCEGGCMHVPPGLGMSANLGLYVPRGDIQLTVQSLRRASIQAREVP